MPTSDNGSMATSAAVSGTVVVSALTSYLDVLYLAFRFSPVFAFPVHDPKGMCVMRCMCMSQCVFAQPPRWKQLGSRVLMNILATLVLVSLIYPFGGYFGSRFFDIFAPPPPSPALVYTQTHTLDTKKTSRNENQSSHQKKNRTHTHTHTGARATGKVVAMSTVGAMSHLASCASLHDSSGVRWVFAGQGRRVGYDEAGVRGLGVPIYGVNKITNPGEYGFIGLRIKFAFIAWTNPDVLCWLAPKQTH
jgi:hypothetical protein